jgi:hypothetical protein
MRTGRWTLLLIHAWNALHDIREAGYETVCFPVPPEELPLPESLP